MSLNEPAPAATRVGSRRGTAFALATVLASFAGTWLWSQWRERPLETRTRDRLKPRVPEHEAASAAHIVVEPR